MHTAFRQWLIVAALIGLIGAVHTGMLREGHLWGDDFAHYLLHARNLVLDRPYAEIGYLYNPHYPAIGPPTYPPGCPLALAPLYALFGLHLTAFKLEMIFFFLVFLGAVYACFREELGFPKAVALVLILGLNHYFVKDTNVIGSDMPFLALLYLAILLVKKAEAAPLAARRRGLAFLAAGVMTYLAFATRTLGALLIPAMLAQDVVTTRRISRPAILATAAFAALAILQSAFLHSDRHYLDQFGPGPMVLVENAGNYLIRLATFWHNGYLKGPSIALFALVSLLAGLGYAESLRRRITVCEVFAALYVAVVLLWPSYQGERYLFPVIPLYVFYALRGLGHPWIGGRAQGRRALVAVIFASIGLTYAARLADLGRESLAKGVTKAESLELFAHLRATTGADDVIVFVKPRAMALFTDRKASVYHAAKRDEELWDYFRRIGATRLVVVENDEALKNAEDPAMLAYLRAFAERNRDRLEPVFSNRDFTVYKLEDAKQRSEPTKRDQGGRESFHHAVCRFHPRSERAPAP